MPSYADLEIAVQHWDGAQYAVEMRFSQPGSDAEARPPGTGANLISWPAVPPQSNGRWALPKRESRR